MSGVPGNPGRVKIEILGDEDLARRFKIYRDINGFRSYAEALDHLLAEAGLSRDYQVTIKIAGREGTEELTEKASYKRQEFGYRVAEGK